MDIASSRLRRMAESVLGELELVLDLWAERIDRHVPLAPHSVASIDALIGAVRRVVSREVGAGRLLPLAGENSVMPADAVLRLLVAQNLLHAFVSRHATVSAEGGIEWNELSGGG
ncbi:MAG TPA: hypothetical protein VL418_12030 [Devosiaceae bacterium]|nr:hypothetical protein [Devosiaceae bacterium]